MHRLSEKDIEIREEFHSFIAEVPEIPGCSAVGATAIEAVENLKAIISELDLN